jgi:superfamily I DNA/RNA helicase
MRVAKMKISPQQENIFNLNREREHWLIGPPGTGKTTSLARNIELARKKHGLGGVLVVSFTKAAAKEIGGRVGTKGTKDGDGIRNKMVGTLHSIVFQELGLAGDDIADIKIKDFNKHLFEINMPRFQLSDPDEEKDDIMNFKEKYPADAYWASIQKKRARMQNVLLWNQNEQGLYSAWCDWKKENALFDFTDSIEMAIEKRIPPPDGTKVIFVDEGQDFTKLQMTLIRRWINSPGVEQCVIAFDDDQSIYGFAGADPDAIIGRKIPESNKRILKQSYRVPQKIHEFSTRWIEKVKNREPKEYNFRDGIEGKIIQCFSTIRNYHPTMTMIEKDLADGKTSMVLATCRYMLQWITAGLRERGIPFHNPYSPESGAWNPLGKGTTCHRIATFLDQPMDGSRREWNFEEFHEWTSVLLSKCFRFRGAKKEIETIAKEHPKRIVPDSIYLTGETFIWVNDMDLQKYKENTVESKRKPMNYPIAIAKRGVHLLKEKPKVIIGTIHSVKGGEADCVHVFPDLSPDFASQWVDRSYGRSELRRIFYVAFTRAKEKLVLCSASGNSHVKWNE